MPVIKCRLLADGSCEQEALFEGLVVGTFAVTHYHDSYWYAVYWCEGDGEGDGRLKSYEYDSTAFGSCHHKAIVDAPPEIQAKARQWMFERWVERLTRKAEKEARAPRKGVRVRSLATRGKYRGVEGTVVWEGVDQFRSRRDYKVSRFGIKTDKGMVFLNEDQLERVEPDPIDVDEIREEAESLAQYYRPIVGTY